MRRGPILSVLAAPLWLAACSPGAVPVGGPFYVMRLPDSAERALHRCPDGPGGGCAIDGLPGPDVFAAAANTTHVTAARRRDGREEYFWFARVPEERRGWGRNPERIIGPLSRAQFEAEVARRGLPEPVRLR